MMNPGMIDDTIEIIMEGVRRRKRVNLIINNRAGSKAGKAGLAGHIPAKEDRLAFMRQG